MRKILTIMAMALALGSCDFTQSDDAPEPAADAPTALPSPTEQQDQNVRQGNEQAERFARMALECVAKQYPNKISHVLSSAEDVKSPQQLYPAFYGCFDWHSSVHGHWLLTRLWGLDQLGGAMDREVEAALARSLTEENIAGERRYFMGEDRGSFERPYGMAWFLQLHMELEEIAARGGPKAQKAQIWADRLAPLESVILEELKQWLPKLVYPIRIGTHNQTAFAFGLMLDWANEHGDEGLAKLVGDKSREFYAEDQGCPIAYEPSGEDFLSPCLMEADLMRRVMDRDEYRLWLTGFLPGIPTDGSADWLEVGEVRDPTDGKLVHLDGLNLSRAWALRGIASALPQADTRRAALIAAADKHAEAGLEAVTGKSYAGGHWLASFATYLTTNRGIRAPAGGAGMTKPKSGAITPVDTPKGKATPTAKATPEAKPQPKANGKTR